MPAHCKARPTKEQADARAKRENMVAMIDLHNRGVQKQREQRQRDLIHDSVRDPALRRMMNEEASGAAVRGKPQAAIEAYIRSVGGMGEIVNDPQ